MKEVMPVLGEIPERLLLLHVPGMETGRKKPG